MTKSPSVKGVRGAAPERRGKLVMTAVLLRGSNDRPPLFWPESVDAPPTETVNDDIGDAFVSVGCVSGPLLFRAGNALGFFMAPPTDTPAVVHVVQ